MSLSAGAVTFLSPRKQEAHEPENASGKLHCPSPPPSPHPTWRGNTWGSWERVLEALGHVGVISSFLAPFQLHSSVDNNGRNVQLKEERNPTYHQYFIPYILSHPPDWFTDYHRELIWNPNLVLFFIGTTTPQPQKPTTQYDAVNMAGDAQRCGRLRSIQVTNPHI
jgi:hypothetical protein